VRAWYSLLTGIMISGIFLIFLGLSNTLPPTGYPSGAEEPLVAATPKATGAPVGSDGTWVVGRELKPGTYTTRVPGTDRCFWVRLSGFGLTMEEVLAVGTAERGQRLSVRVLATDRGFESHGCGTWTRTG
jgi:hypothetical protein